MPENEWNDHSSDMLRNNSWRLLWPTQSAISRCLISQCIQQQNDIGETAGMEYPDETAISNTCEGETSAPAGCLFLKTSSLAATELDILERIYVLEPTVQYLGEEMASFTPHHKTYMRLMNRIATRNDLLQSSGSSTPNASIEGCTCIDLAWFLLTSACLSRGRAHLSLHNLFAYMMVISVCH